MARQGGGSPADRGSERPADRVRIVRLEPGPPTWDIGECVAELESLSVAADARGDGVGTKLLASARALAQEAGAARLLVSVAHSNAAAIRFYQREGFEPFYVLLSEKR